MLDCQHKNLCFDVSTHAQVAGYQRPTPEKLVAAAQPSGRVPGSSNKSAASKSSERLVPANGNGARNTVPPNSTFPAPLVLPRDELTWDPQSSPQSLRSWIQEKARNFVTNRRRTVYVVPPPTAAASASFVDSWTQPNGYRGSVMQPEIVDITGYISAFYHGLPVKQLQTPRLSFSEWKDRKRPEQSVQPLSLDTGKVGTRIRARPSPDGVFSGQLNLNDLLDVAISILPNDAYALLMLVHHDLYEDDDDDFCCGRAYGGSRVAVVSTARYHPLLDAKQCVERNHAWPASHCQAYVDKCCIDGLSAQPPKKKQRKTVTHDFAEPSSDETAMGAALLAYSQLQRAPGLKEDDKLLSSLWLGRVCKTASHELGHCFGIGHCSYYACVMQGTAGLSEDTRQPPYLCPVDTAKLLRATGSGAREWNQAMLAFCEQHEGNQLFAAFAAWLRIRLEGLEALG